MRNWIGAGLLAAVLMGPVACAGPVFAKAAVAIDNTRGCDATRAPETVIAPDGSAIVEFRCRADKRPKGDDNAYPHIRMKGPSGWQVMPPQDGVDEVMWAPDSRAVVINGNENGYTNYLVLYRLVGKRWRQIDVTHAAQRDMVRQFPPCKAFNRDPVECHDFERDPEFNMAAIAWTRNGGALIVMAEVPCTSTYGGIMCAVAGFEIGLDGTILDRMSVKELKARWQHAMAWQMRVPDPPEYGPPSPYLVPHH
jgi:hypothetical protein